MIDVESEELITFAEAVRRLHLGVSPITARRWASHGCEGVVLESVKVGYKRKTSLEAVKRFLLRLTEGPDARPTWLVPVSEDLRRRAKALGLC